MKTKTRYQLMMALLALLVLGLVVTILYVSTFNYAKTISVNRQKTVTGDQCALTNIRINF